MLIDNYNVFLLDNGTLETVISVDGYEVTFSQEYASDFRDAEGCFTDRI
jgi:hypothetical protein